MVDKNLIVKLTIASTAVATMGSLDSLFSAMNLSSVLLGHTINFLEDGFASTIDGARTLVAPGATRNINSYLENQS